MAILATISNFKTKTTMSLCKYHEIFIKFIYNDYLQQVITLLVYMDVRFACRNWKGHQVRMFPVAHRQVASISLAEASELRALEELTTRSGPIRTAAAASLRGALG